MARTVVLDHARNAIIGAVIRDVRNDAHVSLLTAAAMSRARGGDLKASVMGAYERGERTMSLEKLAEVCALYDVPVSYVVSAAEARIGLTSISAPIGS